MVTPIAFGAWAIGGWMWGGADEQEALLAIRTAHEAGMTTIDTAAVYGFGKSEELVGKAMQGIPRSSYQLLTKFGLNWKTSDGEFYFDTKDEKGKALKVYRWANPKKVIEECEDSLRRLKTDYIDLYQIHWPDPTTPIHDTFEAVNKLIQQGKVRAAGVCNYNAQQANEALETIPLVSNQVPYSLINRDIEKEVIPQAQEHNMSIIAYSPLQRGLLTGKIKPGHQFNEGDTREGNRFYSDENIRRTNELLNQIKPIAEKHNATVGQVVINWTLHQPGITCALVGARNEQQVIDNIKAVSFDLTIEEINFITSLADRFSVPQPATT
jgi:aryl-alcohol dehydrogenase-like predicted oxidoreductase